MTYFDELAKGSDAHKAERGANSLRISPLDETTPASFVAFQPVYHKAREQAYNAGLRTSDPHTTSLFSVAGFDELYDTLTIYF